MALTTLEFSQLKELTELHGVASFEDEIRDYLRKEYVSMGYELIYDNLGSIFAYKKSKAKNAPKVMVDGHMDEVGFVVGSFNPDGTIGIIPIGGINVLDILNATYRLKTKDGTTFIGTIINRDVESFEEVAIDFGFMNEKEAKDNGVNYFDMVTFVTEFKEIGDDLYTCKAIDNRYSLSLGLDILHHFKDIDLPFDLYVGGSVQEEVGLRGASCILNVIQPDLAIVLDCSRAVNDPKGLGHIGEGVLLRFFDPSMVAFKELIEFQKECCENSGAKYQYFATRGGTNAGAIHKSLNGVLTLNHCICALNIHTPVSTFRGIDYQSAKKSLIYMLSHFDKNKLDELRSFRK